jgi:hypothetical protein
VQPVDEGTGLYVRGGDFTETRVFLNDAALLNPPQLLTPTGTFVGTVDPFQLDGIFFSSGGFGARYGNALSAVAGLRSQGRAERVASSVGVGLGGPSAAVAAPVGSRVGLRASGNLFSLAPVIRLNGASRAFSPAPHGHDLGASAAWAYRRSGEVKVYALDTRTRLGVGLDEPSFGGTYAAAVGSRFAVATWQDTFGRLAPTLSVSQARLARAEDFGAFRLRLAQRSTQLFASAAWEAAPRLALRGGVEVERSGSALDGSAPARGADQRPDAFVRVLGGRVAGVRDAAFAEADWRALAAVRVVAGLRTDRSTLPGARTADPRVAVAWQPRAGVAVTGAWGVYHQVPDAMLYDTALGIPGLAPMRARQAVAGVQLGDGPLSLRVEAYDKRYADLAQLTRDNGCGRRRGPGARRRRLRQVGGRRRRRDADDVQLRPRRAHRPGDGRGRAGALRRHARGHDGGRAALRRRRARRGRVALGHRAARHRRGRRHARHRERGVDAGVGRSVRRTAPAFRRLDVSASRAMPLGARRMLVSYVSLVNVLDRRNVQQWRYSADYATRRPVRSIFNRSVYFGATLTNR